MRAGQPWRGPGIMCWNCVGNGILSTGERCGNCGGTGSDPVKTKAWLEAKAQEQVWQATLEAFGDGIMARFQRRVRPTGYRSSAHLPEFGDWADDSVS